MIAFYICIAFIALAVFLLFWGHEIYWACVPLVIGYLIFCCYFYIVRPPGNYPINYNPFSVLILIGSSLVGAFSTVNWIRQTCHISNGYTVKQYSTIRTTLMKLENSEEKIDEEYEINKPFKKRLINLYKFFTEKQTPSLVNKNRDI